MPSESVSEFLEYVQRLGIHITYIYQQIQQLELRVENISHEIRQIQYRDGLQREEFTSLARGLLCPVLYKRWKLIPKFIESVTLLTSSCPEDEGFIQEICPRTNPAAQNLLNNAVALDCDWAKRIKLRPYTKSLNSHDTR